jgi:hypothetical protein
MALVPGLAWKAGEKGLAQLTMSACAPLLGGAIFEKRAPARYPRAHAQGCLAFNDSVLTILRRRHDIKVVVLSSPFGAVLAQRNRMLIKRDSKLDETDTSQEFAVEGLAAMAKAIRDAGKRVVIVAPPPNIAIDIGDCLERKARGRVTLGADSDCRIPLSKYQHQRGFILRFLEQVEREAHIDIIYLSDFLCDSKECVTEHEGKLIYRDSGHLSYEGSEIVAQKADLFELIMKTAR